MQHYATVVLDYVSRVEKVKQETRELKLALVTSHILSPSDAFPDLFPNTEAEGEDDELPDDKEVTYVFPNAPENQQSIEQELRSLVAQSAEGTATFADDWV